SRVHRHHGAVRRWHDLDGWADHTRREEAPCEEQREDNPPTTQSKGEGVMTTSKREHPRVVSHSEWLAARKELLTKEKELTRQRDALSAARRALPWPTSSAAKVSSSCNTSCSVRGGRRVARAARSVPTISTA